MPQEDVGSQPSHPITTGVTVPSVTPHLVGQSDGVISELTLSHLPLPDGHQDVLPQLCQLPGDPVSSSSAVPLS